MRILLTSGSLSAGLGMAGAGFPIIFPEQKWIGFVLVALAVIMSAVDIKIENGSIQTKGRKMAPMFLMVLGGGVFFVGLAWYVQAYLTKTTDTGVKTDPDDSPKLTVSFDFPQRKELGSNNTTMNFYFANGLKRDVVIRKIYLKQFITSEPDFNGHQNFDHFCTKGEDFAPGDIGLPYEGMPLKIDDKTLAYDLIPTNVYIDGVQKTSDVFVLPANRSTTVSAVFSTRTINEDNNVSMLCPKIQFINAAGSSSFFKTKGTLVALTKGSIKGKMTGATPGPSSIGEKE